MGAFTRFTMAVLIGAMFATGAGAQDANKQAAREREMLRRAQAAQRQAEEARAAAEAERAKIESVAKDAEAKAAKNAGAAAAERKRAAGLQATLDAAAKARDALAADKEALSTRLTDTEQRLRAAESELARLRQTLAEREASLGRQQTVGQQQAATITDLEGRNDRLYGLVRELMEKYRSQGFWEAAKRREPFTQRKQVEIDNWLEEVRDRADDALPPGVPANR